MQVRPSQVLTGMISLHSSCHQLSLVAPVQSVAFLRKKKNPDFLITCNGMIVISFNISLCL